MRYLILGAVAVVNLIFAGAVFPNINIADTAPNIIVCTMASLALLEKNMTGAVIGLVCGLVLDVFFTGTIGLYALPYFAVGAGLFFVCRRLRYVDRFFLPALIAFGACLAHGLVSALLAYMMAVDFSFGYMFVRYMLPGAALSAALMLLIYFLFTKIYQHSNIKQKNSKDFNRLS